MALSENGQKGRKGSGFWGKQIKEKFDRYRAPADLAAKSRLENEIFGGAKRTDRHGGGNRFSNENLMDEYISGG